VLVSVLITHGNHPRSFRLARVFQCLAVPQQPLKLLELKRLASAVQLRPMATIINNLPGISSLTPVRSWSAFTKGSEGSLRNWVA
jgi:hypothetical protein